MVSCFVAQCDDHGWPYRRRPKRLAGVRIRANRIASGEWQANAVRVMSAARDVRIDDNIVDGEVRRIRPDAWKSGRLPLRYSAMGWTTETASQTQVSGDSLRTVFEISHGLDLPFPLAQLQGIRVLEAGGTATRHDLRHRRRDHDRQRTEDRDLACAF
jgi:hypothetical protein